MRGARTPRPLLGPAGTVHLSVMDFAAWAGWQVGDGTRGPALVAPESLRRMHTPVVAMARSAPRRKAATASAGARSNCPSPEPFLFHGGSNQLNLAYVLLLPRHDDALVLMTNVGGDQADAGLKALAKDLVERYAPAGG